MTPWHSLLFVGSTLYKAAKTWHAAPAEERDRFGRQQWRSHPASPTTTSAHTGNGKDRPRGCSEASARDRCALAIIIEVPWSNPKRSRVNDFFPSYASVALARSSHNVCADERIGQCMSKHPTLGSQKWSADHYVVLSPLQGVNEKENQQNTEPKTNKAAKARQQQTTRETATP